MPDWFQRCKRIIGDFGLRRRNGCSKVDFPALGETYQTDVCQQLQFHDYRQLLHRFARLCKAGSLACGGFEVPVTQTSASAFQQDDFLFVLGDVADIFTRFGVVHHRAAGTSITLSAPSFPKLRFLEPDSP